MQESCICAETKNLIVFCFLKTSPPSSMKQSQQQYIPQTCHGIWTQVPFVLKILGKGFGEAFRQGPEWGYSHKSRRVISRTVLTLSIRPKVTELLICPSINLCACHIRVSPKCGTQRKGSFCLGPKIVLVFSYNFHLLYEMFFWLLFSV